VKCGLILWFLLVEVLKPDTKINTDKLDIELNALTLEQSGNRLPDLLTEMGDYRQRIEAEKGTIYYDKDTYVTMLFAKISCYKQQDFMFEVRSKKKEWNLGRHTLPQIISALKISYTSLGTLGQWETLDSSREQIIALTTKIKDLERGRSKCKTLMAGGNGSGNTNGGGSGEGFPEKSKPGCASSWQITFKGDHITHPEKGFDMVWCKDHTSRDGVVNGMYFRHPHNHQVWELEKKKSIAKHKLEKEKKKNEDVKAHLGKTETPKKHKSTANKLALKTTMKSMLCTTFCVSKKEADDLCPRKLQRLLLATMPMVVTIRQKIRSGVSW
jgi:hypothetical protein